MGVSHLLQLPYKVFWSAFADDFIHLQAGGWLSGIHSLQPLLAGRGFRRGRSPPAAACLVLADHAPRPDDVSGDEDGADGVHPPGLFRRDAADDSAHYGGQIGQDVVAVVLG